MSLLRLNSPHYIKRSKVYVNFEARFIEPDDRYVPNYDIADYEYELPIAIQNVVGIELKSYNILNEVAGTYVGRYPSLTPLQDLTDGIPLRRSTVAGNMIFDAEITDPDNLTTFILTVDMEGVESIPTNGVNINGISQSISDIQLAMFFAIPLALLVANDPIVNFFTYTPVYSNNIANDQDRFTFLLQENAAPNRYATIRLLFKSGPHESDSIHRVLGFDKVDTIPDPILGGAVAPYRINTQPFRYVDVFINEFPEFKPHSRIFLNKSQFSKIRNPTSNCMRLVNQPLQRLDTLSLSLRLEGGKSLSWQSETNHELEFEIISLEPNVNIPNWVQQQIYY